LVFEEPGSAEGPDQDPKPLARVPTLPLLLFGVDWGTLPLSYRRSKKGKPRRAADLEFCADEAARRARTEHFGY